MSICKKMDFHMHSAVSDGTDSPEKILAVAKDNGISLFSLTDHDSVKGCKTIRSILDKCKEPGIEFINGVEFSCRDDKGKYHILGYGYDCDSRAILDVVGKGHKLRMGKVKARLDFIAEEFGFSFPEEEIDALLSLDNPGKPHIGNLMVKYGYAENKKQAISEYIDKLHIKSGYITPEEAICGILGAGGIPVLAHPFFGDGGQIIVGDEMEERIKRLMGFGIQGVEAFYSGFSPKLTGAMLSMADKFNLYVTAGSDYHGKNKLVEIGDTGIDTDAPCPVRLLKFLNALKIKEGTQQNPKEK